MKCTCCTRSKVLGKNQVLSSTFEILRYNMTVESIFIFLYEDLGPGREDLSGQWWWSGVQARRFVVIEGGVEWRIGV